MAVEGAGVLELMAESDEARLPAPDHRRQRRRAGGVGGSGRERKGCGTRRTRRGRRAREGQRGSAHPSRTQLRRRVVEWSALGKADPNVVLARPQPKRQASKSKVHGSIPVQRISRLHQVWATWAVDVSSPRPRGSSHLVPVVLGAPPPGALSLGCASCVRWPRRRRRCPPPATRSPRLHGLHPCPPCPPCHPCHPCPPPPPHP